MNIEWNKTFRLSIYKMETIPQQGLDYLT